MSAERFVGTSARLLAGASVLTVIGVGLVIRSVWQQAGQSYSQDGIQTDVGAPFGARLAMAMFDFTYRALSTQLLLASALVAAAVVLLHRIPSWDRVRSLRWEVFGALLLVMVPVLVLVAAALYLLTSPSATEGVGAFLDARQLADSSLAFLSTLGASLLVLVAATLAWLRLGPLVDDIGDDSEEERDDGLDGLDDLHGTDEAGEQWAVDRPRPPTSFTRDARTQPASGGGEDYRDDWSPEDFRPPS
ncbi:hypothetical protein [Knoellia sp. Soil729]|uniref:hypothetical protein n=1 Tax=Knoellia sp. Soil729 TaxID=1736394 RepID=UPI0006FB7921|nr:hypothetical protein [Knoellia sp. Soil729]KRE40857.1 hypothetical protein ASG74_15400 [Knoellia sp. Soil729]